MNFNKSYVKSITFYYTFNVLQTHIFYAVNGPIKIAIFFYCTQLINQLFKLNEWVEFVKWIYRFRRRNRQ